MKFNNPKEEWKIIKLKDAVEVFTGFPFKSKSYIEDENRGIKVIRGENVSEGFIRWDRQRSWPEITPNLEKFMVQRYDIVIGMDGSKIGKNKSIVNTNETFLLAQRVARLRTKDSSLLEQKFLAISVIKGNKFLNYVNTIRTGTSIPHISIKQIENYEIVLPPIQTQYKISHIISALDDKIELNRKMNQTLEEMAQALFKSWFVDFDPVHVKMGCANDEELEVAARELGISKEVLELFPSKFEESELGMIPKGWSSSDLGYIFTERKEKVKDRTDVSVMSVIQTGELVNPKDVFSKQVHSADISKYKLVYPLDLGYNPSRINIGSAGFNKSKSFGAMSPVYTVMQFQDTKFHPFMELFMKQGSTKKWINTLASGSVRQSLSQNDFLSIPVVIPSDRILNKFNSIYTAFHDSISSKNQEILTLENTRDTLLPKLLSGELDVSELEMETL